MLEQDALAAAAAPDDDDGFALADAEVHTVQHMLRAEALLQVAGFDHVAGRTRFRNRVRKKLLISTVMDEYTTASVVARPTPTAPSPQVMPLWQLMIEMMPP